MARIELETPIAAPPERCFDLSLSVEVHLDSTAHTGERVVAGRSSGLFEAGDEMTWEARHFGRRRRLSMRISALDRPRSFRDELVRGPLRRLVHEHVFEHTAEGTLMRDDFEFATWAPPLDALVLRRHFERLLRRRNETIGGLAEGEGWRRYLVAEPER